MEDTENPFSKYQRLNVNGIPDLTFEQRLDILRKIGKTAQEEFKVKYASITNWFVEYDQVYMLSFCLRYFLMHPEGYDEEAESREDYFAPNYIEILQAFALADERTYSPKPLMNKIDQLRSDMQEVGRLTQIRLFDLLGDRSTEKELNTIRVRTSIMSHSIAVRNWAYHHQMREITERMASAVQEEYKKVYGYCPTELVKLLFKMAEVVIGRVNNHIKKIRLFFAEEDYLKVQEVYDREFMKKSVSNDRQREKMWELCGKSLDDLKLALLTHSDLGLHNLFSFSLDALVILSDNRFDKATLKKIMDGFSFEFGDLKEQNKEFIVLDNPTHIRPFIKTGKDVYFSSLWQSLPHFTLSMLEHLVEKNQALGTKYNSARARYHEEEVESLFKTSFPSAKVYAGSKWTDEKGTQFENDLLVVIDSFALVVEAKSGTVTAPAKRGAPDRLFKTIKKLIEEPSDQALRFIDHLKKNRGELVFSSKKGDNCVDTRKLNYFIPLGVTFYRLGALGANLKLLIEGGIVDKKIHELAPCISLPDLEVVFNILTTEAQKVHYLQRRREFEIQIEYFGDELDLLALYLDTGFDLGDVEVEDRTAIDLSLKSKDLDPYIIGSSEGKSIPKPELKMITWWKDLLTILDQRKPQRWLEFSYVLLNLNIGNQQQFEKGYNELLEKIAKKEVELEHNWVTYKTANIYRQFAVAVYPYTNKNRDARNSIFNNIIVQSLEDNSNLKGIVIIGLNIDIGHYPYSCLAGDLSKSLFEDHFKSMTMEKE